MTDVVGKNVDSIFDMPPPVLAGERRRSSIAESAWQAADRHAVQMFDDFAVVVDDPGGMGVLRRVGQAVTDTFGLVAEMALTRGDAFGAELSAACDLIALRPQPLHFEASLMVPKRACILLRGVALPIEGDCAVQIILSWREVLNRAATAQLRRDFVGALRISRRVLAVRDPFSVDFGTKPAT